MSRYSNMWLQPALAGCDPRAGWRAMHPHRRRGGWGSPGGPRGPRARRGDVRAAVLALLAEEPRNGYGLISAIEERSGGVWRPSPGSIYPVLQLLEDEGLVRPAEAEGRKVFELTDAGREAAQERAGERAPWEAVAEGADAEALALWDEFRKLGGALKQVAEGGDAEQQRSAREGLTELRKRLYRLLGGEDA
jgi:DNA-binding PadR family transcriptional regulator